MRRVLLSRLAFAVCLMTMVLTPAKSYAQFWYGDVNGDGSVTISDVTSLIDGLLTGQTSSPFHPFDTRLSARDYGAVGDGVTDDTEALERLFADAVEFKKAVYFPEGIYVIRRPLTLKSGMEIYGDGDNSVIRKIPAAWHKLTDAIHTGVYNNDEDHTITLKVDGISGYRVGDHCYISYSSNPFDPANAKARFCSYGEIAEINEEPFIENGVTKYEVKFKSAFDSEKHGVVYNHPVGAVLSTSFPILRSWAFKDECVNVRIHDICLDGNRQTNGPEYNNVTYEPMEWANGCIHFDAYATSKTNGISYNNHSYNHVVERCRLINSSFDGISDQGEGGLIVRDCVIENSAMHGVHMGTVFANAMISSNNMTGNGVRGAGVFYCQDVTNVIIDNNEIKSFNHGCSDEEYGTSGKYIVIRNNKFTDITGYVFDFLKASASSRGGGLLITNNQIVGLQSVLFSGKYLNDVVITNNTVSSVTTTPSTFIKATSSNCVIVVGNSIPSGTSVSQPVTATSTTNLINNSNSWN